MAIKEIQYAGHSALIIKTSTSVIAIDPWLADNPSCPAELKKPDKIDLIILTHGHSDHAGGVAELAKKLNSKVCASFELANLLQKDGVPQENLIPVNTGGNISFNELKVSFEHAIHSSSYETDKGAEYAGACLSVVIKDSDTTIFHAGDTALFSDLGLIGDIHQPDYAFLPIGDVFTMGPTDAATAAKWLKCKTAIPLHYDTFPLLTGTAEEFTKACQAQEINSKILKPGESISV